MKVGIFTRTDVRFKGPGMLSKGLISSLIGANTTRDFLGFDAVLAEKMKFENIKNRKWACLPRQTLDLRAQEYFLRV